MKTAGRLVSTPRGLAFLKKSNRIGGSHYVLLPVEWLYSVNNPAEVVVFIDGDKLIIEPFTHQYEVVYDKR